MMKEWSGLTSPVIYKQTNVIAVLPLSHLMYHPKGTESDTQVLIHRWSVFLMMMWIRNRNYVSRIIYSVLTDCTRTFSLLSCALYLRVNDMCPLGCSTCRVATSGSSCCCCVYKQKYVYNKCTHVSMNFITAKLNFTAYVNISKTHKIKSITNTAESKEPIIDHPVFPVHRLTKLSFTLNWQ